jgi:hypothetical protein
VIKFNIKTAISLLVLIPASLLSQNSEQSDIIRLFFLGGQSNMDGYGYNKDLPDSLNKAFENVWIFHGNPAGDGEKNGGLGKWEILMPGHGVGFSSNGKDNNLSDRFGAELSFASKLQKLYPGQKIALIKYSKGGSSIDSLAADTWGCWEPDFKGKNRINQYDHFLNTMRGAMGARDIDDDGREDRLIPAGIIWMQGESDAAWGEEVALRYFANLKRLMDLFRASLLTNDVPVVIGKISDSWDDKKDGKVWNWGELVQYAQEKFARTDSHAGIVRDTRYYKYSDTWHYDSDGYIDLGQKFAETIFRLQKGN